MLAAKTWVDGLLYMEAKRKTYYNNNFPYNCGYINADGSISFDCIGMIKSSINDPSIVTKTSPAGFYVQPGLVIPDYSEWDILNLLCTNVVYDQFIKCKTGEYLYMGGHAGVYFNGNPDVNVVEATAAWRGGVVCSWVDPDGTRRSWRKGAALGRWEAHGQLSRYIDYFTGLKQHKNGEWWFYEDGVINKNKNSVVENQYGWWKVTNGKVDFSFNGLAENENGWWMLQKGKVDFDYNGLGVNRNGIFVLKDGKVRFDYNGKYNFSGDTFNIVKGKVV